MTATLPEIFLVPSTSMLTASLLSMIAAYFISFFSLRKAGMGNESFFQSLACVASGIWLYELTYHYAYGFSLNQLILDARHVDVSGTSTGIFPLLWASMMILLPFSRYTWMHVNRYFIVTTTFGFSMFVVWILVGFPQFDHLDWSSAWTNYRAVIPISTNSKLAAAFLLNSVSKVLVCVPSLLFLPTSSNRITIKNANEKIVQQRIIA